MPDNVNMVWDGIAYKCTPLIENKPIEHIIAFAQQDVRWKDDRMGGVNQTIGGYGCAMVTACMVYTQADQDMTPKMFNDILSDENGYNIIYGTQAHLAWDRLPSIFSRFEWLGRKSWSRYLDDGELANIFDMIDEAPLPLWVDFHPEQSGMQSHFVLGVDHSIDDIEIIDPWEGVRAGLMERYGRNTAPTLKRAIWGYRRLVIK